MEKTRVGDNNKRVRGHAYHNARGKSSGVNVKEIRREEKLHKEDGRRERFEYVSLEEEGRHRSHTSAHNDTEDTSGRLHSAAVVGSRGGGVGNSAAGRGAACSRARGGSGAVAGRGLRSRRSFNQGSSVCVMCKRQSLS